MFINVTHYGKANRTDNFFINELLLHVLMYVVTTELQFPVLILLYKKKLKLSSSFIMVLVMCSVSTNGERARTSNLKSINYSLLYRL